MDPASIAKIIKVDIPIVGHCKVVLAEMLAVLETEITGTLDNADDVTAWWQRIDRWRAEHGLDHDQSERRGAGGSLLPQQVVQAVYRATGGDAYVTSDVGQHQMFAAQYYRFSKPRRWINSGGLGTMGFGFPAAMGVQFAFPDKTVVCITGKGAL